MTPIDRGHNELFLQLRGLVSDMLDQRASTGVVDRIVGDRLDVRLGGAGSVLRNLPIIGGANGLYAGDTVYLLYFGNQAVALSTRGFSEGQPVASAAVHSHDSRYYTRSQTNNLLQGKADAQHVHEPTVIRATAGLIGGWEINEIDIFKGEALLSSRGFIAFADTPPTAFGSNVGAWLGYDWSTNNDAEGQATSAAPKFSLYKDANNYLQWTGKKLLIKGQNFSLDGSGNLQATGGKIGGFEIGNTYLRDLANSFGLAADATGGDDVRFWAGATYANRAVGAFVVRESGLIGSGNFVPGLRGWQVDVNGNMQVNQLEARGELHASVFVLEEAHAMGGSLIIRPAGALFRQITTL